MTRAIPTMDDSVLNMTPMIDIVFQLILFFLFSLNFKSLAYRFEAQLPTTEGIHPTFEIKEQPARLTVSLYRLDEADPATARTKVKFAGREWILPGNATYEEREKTFASLRARMAELIRSTPMREGEILTPLPFGASVPHADVMKVLDTFVECEVADVKFGGTPSPLPRAR